jgi:hypothetical protein
MYSVISEQLAEQVVSTCRTAIGDDLRTVLSFSPEAYDVLYVRSDLYEGDVAQARDAKRAIVENERMGFATRDMYEDFGRVEGLEAGIGDYELTQRVFENGFLTRILVGDRGILVTTDDFDLAAAREVVGSVRSLLRESPESTGRSEMETAE